MADPVEPPADSILNTVKKAIGFEPDYKAFDIDLLMHINSTFATLHQLGVGPEAGYSIEDETSPWSAFLDNTSNMQSVKTYMYMKVRLLFDPPATSFALAATEKVVSEYEWRLNVASEGVKYPL